MAELSGDQKKKLGVLGGFLGVLVVVGFVAMRQGQKPEESTATPPVTLAANPTDGEPPAASPAATAATKVKPPSPAPAATKDAKDKKPAGAAIVKGPLVAPVKYTDMRVDNGKIERDGRVDPFEPFFEPTPVAPPTPTPLPPPVQLPPPPSANDSGGNIRFASAPPFNAIRGLPRPFIARYVPLPGPVWNRGRASDTPPPDVNNVIRSGNKRLSGVIIGDSVRAMLEITTEAPAAAGGGGLQAGGVAGTIVHVVQPGDEVDGIKILRIERVFQDGKQITRMFIKEGEEERFVDLRNAPTPPANAGGGTTGGPEGSGSPTGSPTGGRPSFGRGNFGSGAITPVTPFR